MRHPRADRLRGHRQVPLLEWINLAIQDERLALIGGMHDWAFALGPEGFDCLSRASPIAGMVHGVGLALMVGAVCGCLARPILTARLEVAGPSSK